MHPKVLRLLAATALAVTIVMLATACGGGPPKKIGFAGKSFERGVIAHQAGRQSFLYTIPAEGLAQNERLGVITSTSETPEQLQTWIMAEYVKAMNADHFDAEGKGGFLPPRVLEETPTTTTACKVGRYEDRSFVGLHVCGAVGKTAGCLEIDGRLPAPLGSCTQGDSSCVKSHAADLCREWRGKYEAELEALLPLILAKL